MKKRIVMTCFAVFGVLVLIFDASTATKAGQDALQLCIRVVIPSLFPFFVLVNLLTSVMMGTQTKWLSPLERVLKIPKGSATLFLSGLLGGYPTGAQALHRAWKAGTLDQKNAQRMLAFSSNAGPAFLFGIIGPMFSDRSTPWVIWGIHIVSAILVGCVLKEEDQGRTLAWKQTPVSMTDALRCSVEAMAYVCGWIVLFRVTAAFLSRWLFWFLPTEMQVLLISLLELANGCTSLHLIKNEGLRMIIASAAVNFGGICVLMQTASVTTGLEIKGYIKGKLLQTLFAVTSTVAAQYLLFSEDRRIDVDPFPFATVILILGMLCLLRHRKITVDFPRKLLYNAPRNKQRG